MRRKNCHYLLEGLTVRCKACRYPLTGLTEHRCPECGRDFDPNDPSTYAVKRSVESRIITILLVLAMLLASAVVFAFSYRALRGGF